LVKRKPAAAAIALLLLGVGVTRLVTGIRAERRAVAEARDLLAEATRIATGYGAVRVQREGNERRVLELDPETPLEEPPTGPRRGAS
jgi:hypothetical protein